MSRDSITGWLAAALLLFGPAPPANASTETAARLVTARVIDASTREPLADVAIVWGASGGTTDATGRFTLSVPSDSTLVTARRIGYHSVTYRAADLPAEIPLRRAPVVLTSLSVAGSASPSCCLGRGSHLCLTSTSRGILAERSSPSTAEAMETTEGVSTSRPGCWGSKAYVRGLGGERVVVLLDGNRVNRACNISMDAGLATLNPDNIERVEVLSGPGSTLYGSGNVGGVINVVTRGPRERAPFEGEIRMSASSAVPGGRLGGTVWGRRDHVAFTASADGASYGDQRSPRGAIAASSFRDATLDLTGSYGVDLPHRLDARVQRYAGRDIGYPGSGDATIPEEDRLLVALDYGSQLSRGALDGVNAKLYVQSVDHHMVMSMTKPPATPGGMAMRSETDARSDTDTWGGRAQARLTPAASVRVDAGLEGTQWNADGTRWVEKRTSSGTTLTEYRTWPGVRVAD
jgi:outer membrane receptor protein involved in Fe transport